MPRGVERRELFERIARIMDTADNYSSRREKKSDEAQNPHNGAVVGEMLGGRGVMIRNLKIIHSG